MSKIVTLERKQINASTSLRGNGSLQLNTGEKIVFGKYTWVVLDVQDNNALILSEKIIKNMPYNGSWSEVNWEMSSIRQYLNSTFIKDFTAEEQFCIVPTINSNQSNPWYDQKNDTETHDKVFLLSIFEIVHYWGDSGRLNSCPNADIYWINDAYNNFRIARNIKDEASWWWLRTPGLYGFNSTAISPAGWISMDGHNVDNYGNGIRPALWISSEVRSKHE